VPSADVQVRHVEKIYKAENTISEKKTPTDRVPSYRTRFVSPRLTISLLFRRARRHVHIAWRGFWRTADPPSATQLTLRRMARVKKLIAVLGRLLSSKSDVLTGIKKRLIKAIESRTDGTVDGQAPEEVEIAMYMTDIQGELS
jgi:magnesium transporter